MTKQYSRPGHEQNQGNFWYTKEKYKKKYIHKEQKNVQETHPWRILVRNSLAFCSARLALLSFDYFARNKFIDLFFWLNNDSRNNANLHPLKYFYSPFPLKPPEASRNASKSADDTYIHIIYVVLQQIQELPAIPASK